MQGIKKLRDKMIRELNAIYPEKESYNLANWLFFSVAGMDKKEFSLDPGKFTNEKIEAELLMKLKELMLHKPIQYVTGRAYFHGLELEVDSSVLIPRPETEELVKWVADDHPGNSGLKVLDIGTGSACIILALGRLLTDPVLSAVDISQSALEIASRNAEKLNVRIDFRKVNILDERQWIDLGDFDVIISNPPYVRNLEKSKMQANVLDYEPHEALFVPDDDPLIYYRAIAKFSVMKLSPGGKLYLEINENLGEETVLLLKNEGFADIILKKDIHCKDRMIRCMRIT